MKISQLTMLGWSKYVLSLSHNSAKTHNQRHQFTSSYCSVTMSQPWISHGMQVIKRFPLHRFQQLHIHALRESITLRWANPLWNILTQPTLFFHYIIKIWSIFQENSILSKSMNRLLFYPISFQTLVLGQGTWNSKSFTSLSGLLKAITRTFSDWARITTLSTKTRLVTVVLPVDVLP